MKVQHVKLCSTEKLYNDVCKRYDHPRLLKAKYLLVESVFYLVIKTVLKVGSVNEKIVWLSVWLINISCMCAG